MPLTDELLASKGVKGFAGAYCADVAWDNGYVYGQLGAQTYTFRASEWFGNAWREVWRYQPIGAACPKPAPAYGRLYYACNGEGVVYCFVNQEQRTTNESDSVKP